MCLRKSINGIRTINGATIYMEILKFKINKTPKKPDGISNNGIQLIWKEDINNSWVIYSYEIPVIKKHMRLCIFLMIQTEKSCLRNGFYLFNNCIKKLKKL